MANITKIKASDPSSPKTTEKSAKKPSKVAKPEQKSAKKPFILFRPFVTLGRYLRDSWREIRQVRWPSRKATWKMFLAVIIYSALFMLLVTLLDVLFKYLFNLIFA